MRILLICGHGEGDPGAGSSNYQEATLVREIAPVLKNILSKYADVTLFNPDLNMYKFLKSGKSFSFGAYDYVLELHFNAFNKKATGTEIIVHKTEQGTSVEQMIVDNIAKLGFQNRGVKGRSDLMNMNVCKKQGVSYALLETCFIDNTDDMKLYVSHKNDVIKAIANGIMDGFGLRKSSEVKEYTDINDIVWELGERGIVSDKAGMIAEMNQDPNGRLYWLARKAVQYMREHD